MLAKLSLKGADTSKLRMDNKEYYNFTPYLSRAKAADYDKLKVEALEEKEKEEEPKLGAGVAAVATNAADFPELPGRQNGVSVAGGGASLKPVKQTAMAWGQKKDLFPDVAAPVHPSEKDARQRLENNKPVWSEHDPRNPGWDAARYFVKCLNKYKCPHDRCP